MWNYSLFTLVSFQKIFESISIMSKLLYQFADQPLKLCTQFYHFFVKFVSTFVNYLLWQKKRLQSDNCISHLCKKRLIPTLIITTTNEIIMCIIVRETAMYWCPVSEYLSRPSTDSTTLDVLALKKGSFACILKFQFLSSYLTLHRIFHYRVSTISEIAVVQFGIFYNLYTWWNYQ